jgi:signal peptidase I
MGIATLAMVAIGATLLLGGCGSSLHAYQIAGESMLPMLRPGDRVFVNESSAARSDLHDGDVIALRRDDAIVMKRVLAMPGETISGDHRKVFRNGKQLEEPYLASATGEESTALTTFPSRTIGAEELFVMGDNRDVSFDSRADEYATVRFSDVVGRYSWTYWHASSKTK